MLIHCKHDELIPVDDLVPHPQNRNFHPPDQIERLSKLIDYQGLRAPIIVSNLSKHIVKGHGTLQALKLLGWKDIPVQYQDFEDETQEYAFLQSDNAIAAWASLDLSGINADLEGLHLDNIELLGMQKFTVDFSEKVGSKELASFEFSKFSHRCPKCSFEFNDSTE